MTRLLSAAGRGGTVPGIATTLLATLMVVAVVEGAPSSVMLALPENMITQDPYAQLPSMHKPLLFSHDFSNHLPDESPSSISFPHDFFNPVKSTDVHTVFSGPFDPLHAPPFTPAATHLPHHHSSPGTNFVAPEKLHLGGGSFGHFNDQNLHHLGVGSDGRFHGQNHHLGGGSFGHFNDQNLHHLGGGSDGRFHGQNHHLGGGSFGHFHRQNLHHLGGGSAGHFHGKNFDHLGGGSLGHFHDQNLHHLGGGSAGLHLGPEHHQATHSFDHRPPHSKAHVHLPTERLSEAVEEMIQSHEQPLDAPHHFSAELLDPALSSYHFPATGYNLDSYFDDFPAFGYFDFDLSRESRL